MIKTSSDFASKHSYEANGEANREGLGSAVLARTNERTNATNERQKQPGSSSYVPNAPTPVDNRAGRVEKLPYSVALGELIAELHARGLSREAVAREASCTVRTVDRWRQLNGVSSPQSPATGRRVSAERLDRARAMFEDGVSQREVSRTLGMTRRTLARHFPGVGWSSEQSGEFGFMCRKSGSL